MSKLEMKIIKKNKDFKCYDWINLGVKGVKI